MTDSDRRQAKAAYSREWYRKNREAILARQLEQKHQNREVLRARERERRTPTRYSWEAMKMRCYIPSFKDWMYYGGRGITICDRWRYSFENFLADMGERPEGLTLDRINPDGNYEPGNCRWVTRSEQSRNQRPRRRWTRAEGIAR